MPFSRSRLYSNIILIVIIKTLLLLLLLTMLIAMQLFEIRIF